MNDPRQPGELLWPTRYDKTYLDAHRAQLGPLFEALFQQNPVPLGGNLFKEEWFRGRYATGEDHFRFPDGGVELFRFCPRFAVMDLATGKHPTRGDHTVVMCCAAVPTRTPPLLLVLSVYRARAPLENLVTANRDKNILTQEIENWGCDTLDMEANGFQVTAARLARQCLGIPVREIEMPGKSKVAKALPAIARAEAGQILLPSPEAPWAGELLRELCSWSGEEDDQDDQCDCLGFAVRRIDSLGLWATKGRDGKAGFEEPKRQEAGKGDGDERFYRQPYSRGRLAPRVDSRARHRGLYGGR